VWGELNRFQEEMNRLFDSYGLRAGSWPTFAVAYPAVNIWEDGETVYAEAEEDGLEG
jgi:HSP20 family molecular chaperone IbpA